MHSRVQEIEAKELVMDLQAGKCRVLGGNKRGKKEKRKKVKRSERMFLLKSGWKRQDFVRGVSSRSE